MMAQAKTGGTAISYKDLERGTVIEMNSDDDSESSSSEENYFDEELPNNFKDELSKLAAGQDEDEVDLSVLSIAEVKRMMTPLTEDGMVLKAIVKEGIGPIVPTKCIVLMHYDATVEGMDKPFDSTYCRRKPHSFLLNAGRIIPGLDIAISTMRKGEVSKVWVHSEYAYRDMGCPPRIPANANIVYNVNILNFINCKDAIEFEEMTPEDQKKAPFDKVLTVCGLEHEMGNDMFKRKKYRNAIGRYQNAKKLLEDVSVANEEEDKKRIDRLLKIYLNLSICFLKLNKTKRTICYCKKALSIDEKNTKALYRLGLANLYDNEFGLAKKYLLQAKAVEPHNNEINMALLKLEEKSRKFAAWDKQFCKNVFQPASANYKNTATHLLESPEFVRVIRDRIQQFQNSSEKEYTFSTGFSPNQIDVIRSIAVSQNLHLIEKIYNKQKIIKVMKRNC